MPTRPLALFRVGGALPSPITCRACGRKFSRWLGIASHGLKHVREGKASAQLDSLFGTGGCGTRYLFFLVRR